jgi:hypothetical protein
MLMLQPIALKSETAAIRAKAPFGSAILAPLAQATANSPAAATPTEKARKRRGGISVRASFISGQLAPQRIAKVAINQNATTGSAGGDFTR